MAITRVWQAGCELQSVTSEFTGSVGVGDHCLVDISNTVAKTGSYSLRVGNYDAFWKGSKSAYISLPSALTQMRCSFHWRNPGVLPAEQNRFFSMLDAGGSVLVDIVASNTNHRLTFRLNGAQVGNTFDMATSTWYHIGIDVKKDASAGWIGFYVDGVLKASTTGNTGATAIKQLNFGNWPYLIYDWGGWQMGNFIYFDDMYVDDTTGQAAMAPVPDRRFTFLVPNGNGNYSQWVGSDEDMVNNYLHVDDAASDGDTSYTKALYTSGLKESYALGTFTIPANTKVAAVIPVAIARKLETSQTQLKLGTRVGSTDAVGSAKDLTTGYITYYERQVLNPAGAEWSQSDIDAVEYYQESAGSYT